MFSFEPSEEQKFFIETIHRYAVNDLRAQAHDADVEDQFPQALVEKGWELGYLQASVPEEYGGFGERSAVTGALAFEEMAYGDLAGALTVLTPGTFAMPILMCGSEEQKREFLPTIVEGEWPPYSAALIEPYYDFDPNDLRTKAVLEGDEYILNGGKACVPYATEAKWIIAYANLNGTTQGFIVPGGAEGLEVGEREKLMGVRACPLYNVNLINLRVPQANRLGGAEGHDFASILDASRVAMAALATGMSRAAFEYARDYAKDRDVFGVKVAQKQAIAFMMAEMATEIEAIRLLNWEAAWMLDNQKEDASNGAYLALTGAIDMTMMVTDRAVQILGGHGYIREHPVEMWMRNGRGIPMLTGLAIV
jgi:alkylation response protein AidB-like acyl-CoA dehydrogenase